MDKIEKALEIMDRRVTQNQNEKIRNTSRDYKLDALSDLEDRLESLQESLEEDSKKTLSRSLWSVVLAALTLGVAVASLVLTLVWH